MKKSDKILAVAIIAIAGVFFFITNTLKEKGQVVSIYIGDALYAEYKLSEEQTIWIDAGSDAYNVLTIRNGIADVTDASCPDKLCVHQKSVSHSGETIVCLPNQVVIKVSGEEGHTDAYIQ